MRAGRSMVMVSFLELVKLLVNSCQALPTGWGAAD